MATGFAHEIRVGWGDCDPAKIAYTGRIPEWALASIDAWWEAHLDGDGWFQMELDRGYGTPFVSMQLDFRHPITPRHRLICRVHPVRLGTKSISFAVSGFQNDVLCFEGEFTNVFVDPNGFQSIPAPVEVRALVAPMLPG
ncbi:acyl-CoA thioesterase [Aliishimia ponticola]|uniref:Acyl-CoA thioesterase n=1 Tax=Aliishimia ponticola TaxID=2499833 RepID=A0A4S4NC66_9RHOB|nr:thioesterase family protein [Aliishimia ponticola]THH37016.1 acyl-CoA thioesterase [Aliishimia ponticola]